MRYRHWTDEQKRTILAEYEAAKAVRNGVKDILDKYLLYSNHLVAWKKQLSRLDSTDPED